MLCLSCGKDVPKGERICPHCGAYVPEISEELGGAQAVCAPTEVKSAGYSDPVFSAGASERAERARESASKSYYEKPRGVGEKHAEPLFSPSEFEETRYPKTDDGRPVFRPPYTAPAAQGTFRYPQNAPRAVRAQVSPRSWYASKAAAENVYRPPLQTGYRAYTPPRGGCAYQAGAQRTGQQSAQYRGAADARQKGAGGVSTGSILLFGILSTVFSSFGIPGMVLGAIALARSSRYASAGGKPCGESVTGRILGRIGLIAGIVAMFVIALIVADGA